MYLIIQWADYTPRICNRDLSDENIGAIFSLLARKTVNFHFVYYLTSLNDEAISKSLNINGVSPGNRPVKRWEIGFIPGLYFEFGLCI